MSDAAQALDNEVDASKPPNTRLRLCIITPPNEIDNLVPIARRPAPRSIAQRPVAVGPYRALVRPLDEVAAQPGEALCARGGATPVIMTGIPYEVAVVRPGRLGWH